MSLKENRLDGFDSRREGGHGPAYIALAILLRTPRIALILMHSSKVARSLVLTGLATAIPHHVESCVPRIAQGIGTTLRILG